MGGGARQPITSSDAAERKKGRRSKRDERKVKLIDRCGLYLMRGGRGGGEVDNGGQGNRSGKRMFREPRAEAEIPVTGGVVDGVSWERDAGLVPELAAAACCRRKKWRTG